jgi:hypothetical protein
LEDIALAQWPASAAMFLGPIWGHPAFCVENFVPVHGCIELGKHTGHQLARALDFWGQRLSQKSANFTAENIVSHKSSQVNGDSNIKQANLFLFYGYSQANATEEMETGDSIVQNLISLPKIRLQIQSGL